MNNFEKLAEMLGVSLGEVFNIEYSAFDYVVETDGIWSMAGELKGKANISLNKLLSAKIIKQPWKPEIDEDYFVLDLSYKEGYDQYTWRNDVYDQAMYKRTTLYRTEEEVKARVKELEESGEKWI